MNVSPANSAYASSTNTTVSFGTRRAIVRIAPRGVATPVGLFGFVRNTTRVRGVIAASTSSSGKAKSAFGITCTSRPPATAVRRPEVRDRDGHDAFVEPVGQRETLGRDAEIPGARFNGGCVGWVKADL